MDKSYTNFFPEEDLPKKKSGGGHRVARILAVVAVVLILLGAGLGAYALLKPPSLWAAMERTANDLFDTDQISEFWETILRESRESGADVTLDVHVPADVTGAKDFQASLGVQTSPAEAHATRYDLTVSSDRENSASLTLYDTAERWIAAGLYPEEEDRAVYVFKSGLADALKGSAWNPSGGGDVLTEEEFQMLLDIAQAVEQSGEAEGSAYSEAEKKELNEAVEVLAREWREIIAPTVERSFSAGLYKTMRMQVDSEKLLQMVQALRRVIEEYPTFADLLRSTVTFTEYGEEMLVDDAVIQAKLPVDGVPTLQPLSEETEENDPEKLLDRLEEWLTEEMAESRLEAEIAFTVHRGRLSTLSVNYLYDNQAGDRESYRLTANFFPRDTENTEEQLLATVLAETEFAWAASEGLEAGEVSQGAYLRYAIRETEDEREYIVTVATAPASAEEESLSPDPMSVEKDVPDDPETWESNARYTLWYDCDAEKFRFSAEGRKSAEEEWSPSLVINGVWRPSERGTRLEFGLESLTVTAPVINEKGEVTEDTSETVLAIGLLLIWEVGDGEAVTPPADAEDLLGYTAEEIRALREAGLDIRVADVLAVSFGGDEVLYTVDGLRLHDIEYYQSVANTYLYQYQGYLNRNGKEALSHICIYDEESGLYVLLDFDWGKNYLSINFLAEMTDRYAAAYHTGTMWHGRLEGHMFEEIPGLEPTCDRAGYYAYACTYCDATKQTVREPKGHIITERSERRVYDDGAERLEHYYVCDVCGGGIDATSYAWVASRYHLAVVREGEGEEVSLAYGFSGDMSRGTMLRLPDAVGKDGRFPVTRVKSDAFSSSEMYTLLLIRFGENIRHVEKNAFAGATGLQILVLYPTLEQIDADAFAACTSLRKVYFCGTEAQWKKIRIAEGNAPLTEAEIIFNHDGSFVGGEVINVAAAGSSLRTLTANSRDGKQGEVLASHPDADRLTVLSTAAVQAVAYDADSNAVVVCGGYDSASGVTTVTFFDADTAAVKETWSLPYRVHAMDAGDGYAVFGEAETPTVHLFRLSDGAEVATYRVEMYTSRDYIGYVFIDRGVVIACNADQHCEIDFYTISADRHVRSERMYEPALALDKESHTLAAISQNSSPKSIYFYDSQTGEQITWIWNVDTEAPLRWNGVAFETYRMTFSTAGEPIEAMNGLEPWAAKGTMVYETIIGSHNYVFWTVALPDAERSVVLTRTMAATEKVSLSEPIAFYAARILRMGSEDRFLMWDEGYTQLLIVDLR